MMTCLVSAKGSPGTSTTALALSVAGTSPTLLAECDPAGGDLRCGLLAGMGTSRNLVNLATVHRNGQLTPRELAQQLYALDAPTNSMFVLPGLTDPMAAPALEGLWEPLAAVLRACSVTHDGWSQPCDVLADCGRLDHRYLPGPVLRAADLILITVRSTLASVVAAAPRVEHLRQTIASEGGAARIAAALIDEGPYSTREVTQALGTDVAIQLPYDPTSVSHLARGTGQRRLTRSRYMRAARAAATSLPRLDLVAPGSQGPGRGQKGLSNAVL